MTAETLDVAEFLTARGLDLRADRDPYLVAERAAQAVDYMGEHTPPRYGDAFPTHPDVLDWCAAVISAAVTASAGRPSIGVRTGPSLLLLGATGTGKTYEAYGAVRLISAAGLHTPWLVICAADLYARMRPRHGVDAETEFRRAADAPLLVVDDLGAAKTSEWVEEINYRLVNHRYEQQFPTLFTSNVPPAQLKDELGDRVASRLAEMTRRVVIKGTDRRRA